MLPTVEERLDSIIRALTTVVLTSLPADAKLAREQVQLSVGHLSILREQIGIIPQFEREELVDAVALATALLQQCGGGKATFTARQNLEQLLAAQTNPPGNPGVREINSAMSDLIEASFRDGSEEYRRFMFNSVTNFEKERSKKDRIIFKSYGFDG